MFSGWRGAGLGQYNFHTVQLRELHEIVWAPPDTRYEAVCLLMQSRMRVGRLRYSGSLTSLSHRLGQFLCGQAVGLH